MSIQYDLRCPNCGSNPELQPIFRDRWEVICIECGDGAPDGGFTRIEDETPAAARESWRVEVCDMPSIEDRKVFAEFAFDQAKGVVARVCEITSVRAGRERRTACEWPLRMMALAVAMHREVSRG